ncbi:MAG: TylF/MycF/NovP-related O-methyltransferase [Reyranellaceae bacterium]
MAFLDLLRRAVRLPRTRRLDGSARSSATAAAANPPQEAGQATALPSSLLAVGSSSAGLIEGPGTPITFNADGLATVHSAEFLDEPRFAEAVRLGMATATIFSNVRIEWRLFVACWAASHARNLAGDFVECGVNTGVLSRAVIHYVDFAAMPDRQFYLLDTYRGLVPELLSEEELAAGRGDNRHYPDCYDQVCRTFAPFPNVRIVRGAVPSTLAEIRSDRIAYVSIDMNCVAPEIAAGEFLWPRLVPGAVIVLDDYGWRPFILQKRAWDAFAQERGVKVLALPTGQGLLIKP